MRTVFYGLITLVFCFGAMMGGLNSGNIWIGYGLAFVAIWLFARGWMSRDRKAAERKMNELKFRMFMERTLNKR